jgi:uncharacterized protein (TIGR03643 family)
LAGDLEILLSTEDVSRIIEMAWEDRTPFDAIKASFGLAEQDVKELLRQTLSPNAYVLWRKRVNGRVTKHQKLRESSVNRCYSPDQYKLKNKK